MLLVEVVIGARVTDSDSHSYSGLIWRGMVRFWDIFSTNGVTSYSCNVRRFLINNNCTVNQLVHLQAFIWKYTQGTMKSIEFKLASLIPTSVVSILVLPSSLLVRG